MGDSLTKKRSFCGNHSIQEIVVHFHSYTVLVFST
jgi:hypothetical protein